MATYTVKVKSVCAGGGHFTFAIYKDGKFVKDVMLHRVQIMDGEIDLEDALPFLLRTIIKQSDANTLAQAKTAVESASLVI